VRQCDHLLPIVRTSDKGVSVGGSQVAGAVYISK
jgi:hypothetical protein